MVDRADSSGTNAYLEVNADIDKYIIVYTLLKLNLISGKVIIYTNTKSTGYRLKLFLEEFFIKTLILNYELPKATRHLTVTNFVNSIDVLVVIDPDEKESQNKDGKRHKIYKVPVSVLINFDIPTSSHVYNKRNSDVSSDINAGISLLSLVTPEEQATLNKIKNRLEKLGKNDMEVLALKSDQFEKFRYRCEDILKTITHRKIKASQLNDVKKAILSSKESKAQFENNPEDKKILAQAKKKHKPMRHLSVVPDYLLPDQLRKTPRSHKVNHSDFEKKLAKRQNREPRDVNEAEMIEETPENIAWQDLTPTSNRKLWKIRHRQSLAGKAPKKPRRY